MIHGYHGPLYLARDFFYKSVFIIFSCLLLLSCSKKSGSSASADIDEAPSLCVVGDDGANPILWKNGKATVLSLTGGSASQVLVAGPDLYVAGITDQNFNNVVTPAGPSAQPCYWKNGTKTNIGAPTFVHNTNCSIALAGKDVYFSTTALWKNGVIAPPLLEGSTIVSAVFTVGTDVYCAGYDSLANVAYWKNGTLNVVAPKGPGVFCLYVSGNDVYIGGVDANNIPTYWKNGTPVQLHSANGYFVSGIRALFVSGNDVYAVANVLQPSGYTIPAYWKNGVEQDLYLGNASYGNANGIFVLAGSDVYIAGQTTAGAVYWKNNSMTILNAKGQANSISFQ